MPAAENNVNSWRKDVPVCVCVCKERKIKITNNRRYISNPKRKVSIYFFRKGDY